MPIHEFKCAYNHVTEKLFLTFAAAEGVDKIPCEHPDGALICGLTAKRVEFSVPKPAHFYGNPEGYHKPSPLKRFSTKLVSQKEGNKSAVG